MPGKRKTNGGGGGEKEDGGCHEDQEFLFVIIVHVDFLFTVNVNHANDVEWI